MSAKTELLGPNQPKNDSQSTNGVWEIDYPHDLVSDFFKAESIYDGFDVDRFCGSHQPKEAEDTANSGVMNQTEQ